MAGSSYLYYGGFLGPKRNPGCYSSIVVCCDGVVAGLGVPFALFIASLEAVEVRTSIVVVHVGLNSPFRTILSLWVYRPFGYRRSSSCLWHV